MNTGKLEISRNEQSHWSLITLHKVTSLDLNLTSRKVSLCGLNLTSHGLNLTESPCIGLCEVRFNPHEMRFRSHPSDSLLLDI